MSAPSSAAMVSCSANSLPLSNVTAVLVESATLEFEWLAALTGERQELPIIGEQVGIQYQGAGSNQRIG